MKTRINLLVVMLGLVISTIVASCSDCNAKQAPVKEREEMPLVFYLQPYDSFTQDDPHCLMQDAKGGNPLERETGLCDHCYQKLCS